MFPILILPCLRRLKSVWTSWSFAGISSEGTLSQSSNPWKADSLHALGEALHADPRFGCFDVADYGVNVGVIAPSIQFFGSQESPVGI
jgi:hypothetical protein